MVHKRNSPSCQISAISSNKAHEFVYVAEKNLFQSNQ